jgi:hypothetical protein
MTPNIDILHDFAYLQKQNHELSNSNTLLANRVIELQNGIDAIITWSEENKKAPLEIIVASINKRLKRLLKNENQ